MLFTYLFLSQTHYNCVAIISLSQQTFMSMLSGDLNELQPSFQQTRVNV